MTISVITSEADEQVRVEFYGLARQRTGTAAIDIPAAESITLASLWRALVIRFPQLATPGADSAPPTSLYRINLDGQQFVTHPQTPITRGRCVLIMSADVGG
jgi:hypothetical protein